MAETRTMTVPPVLPVKNHHHQTQVGRQTVSILAVAPTLSSQTPSEAGATVYIAGSATRVDSSTWHPTITEVQSSNDFEACKSSTNFEKSYSQNQPAHVVKIRINPESENSRVISTVRLSPEEDYNCSIEDDAKRLTEKKNIANVKNSTDSRVRISVLSEINKEIETRDSLENPTSSHCNDMVQQVVTNEINRSNTCFYYGPFQNPINGMVMSSGQCSPSDTLDSGTCSDLDGTPPPLPKKNNPSTVVLGVTNKHTRTGSLTSSGAEVDSDDNESNISCDSLNSRELAQNDVNTTKQNPEHLVVTSIDNHSVDKVLEATADELGYVTLNNNNDDDLNKNLTDNNIQSIDDSSLNTDVSSSLPLSCISPSESGTSSLSKSSSTPRVRSPNPLTNGHLQNSSPVVNECTYEERKQDQDRIEQETAAAEHYANYKRDNGTPYVYEDDRFYKFHINELEAGSGEIKQTNDSEMDEYFAGYKILDREAIRSAKGTVRGVKNRVRAGIATFLQNPSSKNYKQKDAGKVVVYTTSMRVVRKTTIACVKMMGILGTHMVDYEERNLFTSREFQTELKDRLGSETVDVPQLFIDGQYIGDADVVERLNESGELRPMLKPYKCPGKRQVCGFCGGAGAVPCIVCNGSKKSPKWNNFMNEFVALRCMRCDEVGLIRCQYCISSQRTCS